MEKEKVLTKFLTNEDAICVDSYLAGVEDAEECRSYDMSIHSNPDAAAWTKFFREKNPDCNVDDQTMFGWFANAMMVMNIGCIECGVSSAVVGVFADKAKADAIAAECVEGDNE